MAVSGMPRRPDFEPAKTSSGWMVSIPPTLTANGKRTRKFFPDEAKAKKYAGTMRAAHNSGVRGSLIPAVVAREAAEAVKLLEGTGLSLVDAARMAAAQVASSADRETFEERWSRAMLHGEMVWSDVYAVQMGTLPRWLGPEVMASRCGMLTREVLKAAIERHGTKTASTVRFRLSRALAVLGNRERGEAKRAEIRILTVKQAARVLRVCERPAERWAVAVLLFAGIRPSVDGGEITRLQWEDFTSAEIYVSSEVAKTPQDRHVPISPRLARLLRGRPADGPVMPSGWKRAWARIRLAAGIAELNDVTRHTFASNYLAAFGEAETKQAMGHTAGSSTLFRHYRRAVTAEAGKRYFR